MHTAQIAGAICLDLVPQLTGPPVLTPGVLAEVGPLVARPGGPVANTGGILRALGAQVRLTANVGDDDLARVLCRLVEPGIDDALAVVEGTTCSYSLVVQPPGVDRTYWHHVGANATFDGSGVDPTAADLLHLGYPSMLPALTDDGGRALRRLFAAARAGGATTSLDLSFIDPGSSFAALDWMSWFRDVLPEVDVLSPSIADLTSAMGEPAQSTLDDAGVMARRLLAMGPALVMVTVGPAGLVVRTGTRRRLLKSPLLRPFADRWSEREIRVPAVPVTVVDSSCAGDAATAGLLYGILAGSDPPEAANLAAVLAAHRVMGVTRFEPYRGSFG